MLNKWTLTFYEFHFPILLSIAHMAFSFVALSPFMLTKSAREQHHQTISKQVRRARCWSTLNTLRVHRRMHAWYASAHHKYLVLCRSQGCPKLPALCTP